MKGTGILLDPETSDLKINTARDARGLIAGGLEIGRTTYQNQAVILQAHKGEFKEYPLLGAGISDILGGNNRMVVGHLCVIDYPAVDVQPV